MYPVPVPFLPHTGEDYFAGKVRRDLQEVQMQEDYPLDSFVLFDFAYLVVPP